MLKRKGNRILKKSLTALTLLAIVNGGSLAQAAIDENFQQTFSNPSTDNRPLTRWWIPGANMTKSEIRREIESMSRAGFGGAEVVPVAMDGGDGNGEIEWGTDRWKDLTNYMLEVAGEFNFTIDFTMTPAWPLALPTIQDVNDPNQGAQMELDGAWVDGITRNNPFSGDLPVSEEAVKDSEKVHGQIELIGVTVAKYVDKDRKILDYDSAQSLKIKNGRVEFKPKDDGEYVLFAWYQHPSGNVKYGNNQVDHFSRAGSQMIIDYWEKNLIPSYGANFKNVRSLFIDSLEFETHLDWTPNLAREFKKSRGYDLVKYLPAVYDSDAYGNFMGDPAPDFKFNRNNEQLKNDFREFLTQLYIENHVKPLEEFCKRHGISLRYQTSYGKSLEVAQTAMYPDIPETESLYGNDYLDFYRLQSGAVHVTGKKIYSLESAAEWTEQWNPRDPVTGRFKTRGNGENSCGNYQQTFQDHIWHDQRAFSAGVNQIVFHGYAYNGQFDGENSIDGFIASVRWPGFDGFSPTTWSNSFGERQPNWIFARSYLDFLTRNQFILRQGTPKIDLAIYYQSYYETIDFIGSKKILDDGGNLEQHGFSYDFLSPAALKKISVKNGRLDFDGASYKALILNDQSTLTEEATKKLIEFAKAGLPIIIVGKSPESYAFIDKHSTAPIQTLLNMPSVTRIKSANELFETLQKLGIESDARYSRNDLLTVHRSDENVDYYFLYNYGDVGSFRDMPSVKPIDSKIVLTGAGDPYKLNAWTGEITRIENFNRTEDRVEIDLHLVGNDSTIIALTDTKISDTPDKIEVGRNFSDPIVLRDWDLQIESWAKGNSPADMRKEIINVGKLERLVAWNEIQGLENVSGIGIYSTSFDLPENLGVEIQLPRAKDTLELRVNDQIVPLDPIEGRVDISRFVQTGRNQIKISVASTLLNAVLKENVEDQREVDNYGLMGDVTIQTYSL